MSYTVIFFVGFMSLQRSNVSHPRSPYSSSFCRTQHGSSHSNVPVKAFPVIKTEAKCSSVPPVFQLYGGFVSKRLLSWSSLSNAPSARLDATHTDARGRRLKPQFQSLSRADACAGVQMLFKHLIPENTSSRPARPTRPASDPRCLGFYYRAITTHTHLLFLFGLSVKSLSQR